MKIESLDLHGLCVEEALNKTQQSLKWCLQHGVDILDINHGKGYHSSRNFSVVKQEIRKMLNNETSIKSFGYRIIPGESNYPIALTYDEGHTLIVARGNEQEYVGGKKQQEKNKAVFSSEGRKKRKNEKRKYRR
ncbi:MAG: Smr/MutS family protein [Syntrophomonadaceae bacterium]|nr:Smr/MutS family protein [Syntrophomonadaceae bacterium]MDD4550078.1 Smr/MutS family protein [Syntrophomonadaceae bacterium]